jgi:hypothetical protein
MLLLETIEFLGALDCSLKMLYHYPLQNMVA